MFHTVSVFVTLYLFVFIHVRILATFSKIKWSGVLLTDYSIHLIRKLIWPWLPLPNKGAKLACHFLHEFILMTVSLQHCSHQFVNLPFKLSKREIYKYAGGAQKSLFCYGSPLGIIVPLEVRSPLILLAFQKSLKSWLCQMSWGPNGRQSYWGWLMD